MSPKKPNDGGTTSLAIRAVGGIKTSLDVLTQLMEAIPIPFVKGVAGTGLKFIQIAEAVKQNKDDYKLLATQVAALLEAILRGLSGTGEGEINPVIRSRIEVFGSTLLTISNQLEQFKSRSLTSRILDHTEDPNRIKEHQSKIQASINAFQVESVVNQSTVQTRIHSLLMSQAQRDRIEKIPRAKDARYNPSRKCLHGTRTHLLGIIRDWAMNTDRDQPRILWLHGLAGTGKSTIASSIAALLDDPPRHLGASFFFSRKKPEQSSPQVVFTTLAHQLAFFHPIVTMQICKALEETSDLTTAAALIQFQRLISQPLHRSPGLEGPIVIVLDALDECKTESSSLSDLLSILVQEIPKLPTTVKFFVTSRPEPEIFTAFQEAGPIIKALDLQEIARNDVERDIRLFLRTRLGSIAKEYRYQDGWPEDGALDALARGAAGLFIWAFTAVEFIKAAKEQPPDLTLESLLPTNSPSTPMPIVNLNNLYNRILRCAFPVDTAEPRMHSFREVVGAITTIREPLSARALGSLLKLEADDRPNRHSHVLWVLRDLQSVVVVPEDGPVRIIHPSFIDFLTNSASVDDRFFIDIPSRHKELAQHCLSRMNRSLTRDICQTERSLLLNNEIRDLDERLSAHVPEDLKYACLFWAVHLAESPKDDNALYDELTSFCYKHLLHWLEVLSLLGEVDAAIPLLESAQLWMDGAAKRLKTKDNLGLLLTDGKRFLLEFREPIRLGAPHIYHSALTFTPRGTELFKVYKHEIVEAHFIVRGIGRTWTACMGCFEGHDRWVRSVVFARDGKIIVSGSDDKTLRLWDTTTGAAITEPLKGHDGFIFQVASSPNGKLIVSGSADKTLRLWDSTTGAAIGKPLEGHDNSVTSVAFSPNGKHIISGSDDNTLRLWDSSTGDAIGEPLKGHSGPVRSVAFSPNGKVIVSGSADNTLRLWDSATGVAIGKPLKGHRDVVTSVAFSPDSNLVVSGSKDSTLRLWDSTTGAAIGKPLEGHNRPVRSVAFSPTENLIVSGSNDFSLRLWDSTTGTAVGEPLKGHTHPVRSVAFSPNGKLIISCSEDNTLRLWDSTSRAPIEVHLEGHRRWASCVAFSPNGKLIVSGSNDQTVRLWDSITGSAIREFNKRHHSKVKSVAFSPNGNLVVSGSEDKTLRLWNSTTGAAIGNPLKGHHDFVTSVAFSPDQKLIVSGSKDKTLRLWNSSGGKVENTLDVHTDAVRSVAFSPNGEIIISGLDDKTIRLWNSATGYAIGDPLIGHSDPITSVAFSPDGDIIISKSIADGVLFWDVASHTRLDMHQLSPQKREQISKAGGLVLGLCYGWMEAWNKKKLFWVPVSHRGGTASSIDQVVCMGRAGRTFLVAHSHIVHRLYPDSK